MANSSGNEGSSSNPQNTPPRNEGSSSDPTRQSPQNTPPRSPTGTGTLDRTIARSPPPRTSPPPPASATRPIQPPPPPMAVAVATALRALMNLKSETVAPGGSSLPTTGDDVLYRPVGRFVLLPTVPPRPTLFPPPPPSIGVAGTTAFRPFKNSPPEVGGPGGSSQPTSAAGTLQRRIDRLITLPTTLPPPPPPVSPPSSPPMGVPGATAIPFGDGGSSNGGLTIQAGCSQIGEGVLHHQQPPPPPVVGGGGVGADVAEEGGHGGGGEEEAENFVVPNLNHLPEPDEEDD